jgi:hypothetical protein
MKEQMLGEQTKLQKRNALLGYFNMSYCNSICIEVLIITQNVNIETMFRCFMNQ